VQHRPEAAVHRRQQGRLGHQLQQGAEPGRGLRAAEVEALPARSCSRSRASTTSPSALPTSCSSGRPNALETDGLAHDTTPSSPTSTIRSEPPVTSERNGSSQDCSRSVRSSRSRLMMSWRRN